MKFNAAFWKWFGDSKVVDSKGKPLVVYHATSQEFKQFDVDRCEFGCHFGTIEQAASILRGRGIDTEDNLLQFYLSVKNPIRMVDFGKWDFADVVENLDRIGKKNHGVSLPSDEVDENQDNLDWLRKKIIKAGYDGIVYLNRREGMPKKHDERSDLNYWDYEATDTEFRLKFPVAQDSWIILKETQAKSAKNDGTWNADDPDIRSNPEDFSESEDWASDEYFARLENAIRDSKEKIFADAGNYAIVRLKRKDGLQLIVHQTSQSGKSNWQVSWLEKDDTPSMHTLFKKRDDALASIAGAGNGPSIGLPFEWEVVETRNIRKS